MTTATPANRLIHEKSPYLLQHAHNPVDWRPWGDEAFAYARRSNRPIFCPRPAWRFIDPRDYEGATGLGRDGDGLCPFL